MKIFVIGDSHGNISNLKHVMCFAKSINVGAIIHTGDWDNLESVKTVLEYKIPLYSCLGNADIDPLMKEKFKEYLEIELDGKKIYIVHKFLKNDKKYIGKDVCFTGHLHSQKMWEIDGVKIVRPGALENNISFAVYDTVTDKIEFINN
ncbi:hypothetical protein A2422_03540 [Candidatus Woesebacteria bacterium RIFOXYC1_FULL_31_51]|uniref:Calcineurin-like phosphoesterase domain-containing protein n=1 Tax=Candidatus Woesebacteria bacterium GW2011_GWC2_31_9 TaxID=1618586 RepID=A0A0F9YIF2_9BACT|nr:MAG: hypothetical protein UR17_C0001G0214 [Candidatus Woesebacteria bacterium GW2011_GWF1_31_35]KKP23289.1 MAG: hypothetical protein UR11_C0001G0263 [Candidatus Woesebacteria bacterium GW2011_GWC1_30_29]KKP26192.1 MAG: hypothetical protein UR13_C0005G0075 [Candidatus Woesebacteria bacterium GW2011_GWD1_31_12]KKP27551.1 MAG: hypothetical protein UR16_C0003G0211 [Candidatus Woesebacteria bacterium GW2011_GWB1_31_29]KKP31274.1 MAG: hypothetical protein UR21_C0012G0015 [Candidatus Woesebacteria 